MLGQDQDSLGGGFSSRDAFSGNLTDFHLWARALNPAQLHRVRACAPPNGGLLFRWDLGALDVTPSLLPPVRVRLLCPGTVCHASCRPDPTLLFGLTPLPLAPIHSRLTSGLSPPRTDLATSKSDHVLSGPRGPMDILPVPAAGVGLTLSHLAPPHAGCSALLPGCHFALAPLLQAISPGAPSHVPVPSRPEQAGGWVTGTAGEPGCSPEISPTAASALRGVPNVGPRIRHRGLFALPAAPALPLLLPDRCALAEPWALLMGKLSTDCCRLRGREQVAQPGGSEYSQSQGLQGV